MNHNNRFTGVCPINSMRVETGSDLEPEMMKSSEQRALKGSIPVSQLVGSINVGNFE